MISAPRVQVGLRLAGAGGQTIEQFSTEKTKYVSVEQNVFTDL
jgi:hypothetical protein